MADDEDRDPTIVDRVIAHAAGAAADSVVPGSGPVVAEVVEEVITSQAFEDYTRARFGR